MSSLKNLIYAYESLSKGEIKSCEIAKNISKETTFLNLTLHEIIKSKIKKDENVENLQSYAKDWIVAQRAFSIEDVKDFLPQDKEERKKYIENIIYSSKIILKSEKDYIDFLKETIKIGMIDFAYSQIEYFSYIFEDSSNINEIIEEIKNYENNNPK